MGTWKHDSSEFFGVELTEDEAARKLQSLIRGFLARKRLHKARPTIARRLCSSIDGRLPVLLPTSAFRLQWDGVAMFFIIYQFFIVPYYIAWLDVEPYSFVWDSIVDWFFLVDILLNFRTGVVTGAQDDEMHMVSTNGFTIAKYYLKGWFLLDFLATLPGMVDFFTEVTKSSETSISSNSTQSQLLKILRCFKIFKLVRVIKSSENIHAVFEGMEDRFNLSEKYKRVLGMLVKVIFLTHLIACSWFGISKYSAKGVGDHKEGTWEGDENAWYTKAIGSELFLHGNHRKQYIWSLYWAMTTISTVGYGDISPGTMEECVYCILAMCVGVSFFGYLLGSISEIAATDSAAVRMQERMTSLSGYLSEKKVPAELKRKVRNYFRYMLMHKSMFDEQSILEDLSLKLRVELTSWINKDTIARVPLLQHLDAACVNMIVENLNPDNFDKGEMICHEGDAGREMFFICHGAVELQIQVDSTGLPSSDIKKVRRLVTGDHFGELPLLPSYQASESEFWKSSKVRRNSNHHHSVIGPGAETSARRLTSARAYTVCDVYTLRKEALDAVFVAFPEVLSTLESEARCRKASIDKVRHYWAKYRGTPTKVGAKKGNPTDVKPVQEDGHMHQMVSTGRVINFGFAGMKHTKPGGRSGTVGGSSSSKAMESTVLAMDERLQSLEGDVRQIQSLLIGISQKLGATPAPVSDGTGNEPPGKVWHMDEGKVRAGRAAPAPAKAPTSARTSKKSFESPLLPSLPPRIFEDDSHALHIPLSPDSLSPNAGVPFRCVPLQSAGYDGEVLEL